MSIDKNQFVPISSKEMAYFLGFLWADGYLAVDKDYPTSKNMRLEIIKSDLLDIQTILDKLGKLHYSFRDRPNRKPQGTVHVGSGDFCNFLYENDYYNKAGKSPDKILSNLNVELLPYWWHGYFDGDGCFYRNPKTDAPQLSFGSCINQDWRFAIDLFETLDINYNIRNNLKTKTGKFSCIRSSNADGIVRFLLYIYKDKELIGLSRKHNKTIEYLEFYHNRLVSRLVGMINMRDIIAQRIFD